MAMTSTNTFALKFVGLSVGMTHKPTWAQGNALEEHIGSRRYTSLASENKSGKERKCGPHDDRLLSPNAFSGGVLVLSCPEKLPNPTGQKKTSKRFMWKSGNSLKMDKSWEILGKIYGWNLPGGKEQQFLKPPCSAELCHVVEWLRGP